MTAFTRISRASVQRAGVDSTCNLCMVEWRGVRKRTTLVYHPIVRYKCCVQSIAHGIEDTTIIVTVTCSV